MDEKAKGNCIFWPISVRDVKKAQRRHIKTKDISKLKILVQSFLEDKKTTVPQEYQDHSFREIIRLQRCVYRTGLASYLQTDR